MADRGPSPLGDPGNLHVYSMNGGSHKLSEIVSDVSGEDPGLISNMPPNHLTSPDYPLNPETQGLAMSYINIAPLDYSDGYEDLKRPPHGGGGQYYGGSVEGMQCTSASYDQNIHGYPPQSGDMFGKSSDSMGYIHMLSSSDSMVPGLGSVIKKEKIDYSEHGGASISCANPTPDIPYPPNTSMQDWHYYNSMATRNVSSSASNLNQSNFGMMDLPAHGPQFHGNHAYTANPNNTPISSLIGMSNEDIHEQSRKISEGYLTSSWCPETLYKSNLYSNLVAESTASVNSRRKRPESDKSGRVSKSRRNSKKPSEHSKPLLSDGSLAGKGHDLVSRSHLDDSVLNSSERNSLVTTLMNNLRSTVQYESFCLSFPRLHQKERAFHCKVLSTLNLIDSIGSKTIVSNPFPSPFVKGASKIVNTFKHALEKQITSESKDSRHAGNDQVQDTGVEESRVGVSEGRCYTDGANLNLSSDQVEEHLPHSMAWILKVGDRSLRAKWEGQFVVTVNPVHSTICVSVFEFRPNFSPESHTCLQENKLTKELAQEIVENMEQFEVSRQLRFDVNLKKVIQMYLHTTHADGGEGCIVMEVSEKPAYFQKWLHTSAEERNKWRRRQSFFSHRDSESAETVFVCIGGLLSELNELAALMLATNPDLQTIYNRGVDEPLISKSRWQSSVENGDMSGGKHDNAKVTKCARKGSGRQRVLDGNVNTLREEILTVLAKFDIRCSNGRMDNEVGQGAKTNLDPNRNRCNTDNSLEIELDPQLSSCFRDYINYECDNASELSKFLETALSPRSYGFYENDFDLDLVPDGDIDRLTVGELIASKCSETVYFSFCRKEVGQLGHDRHCSKCRICNTWRYWHCDACDRCSCSRLICEYCGRLRDDQSRSVIKPFSVFRSQEKAGTLSLDDVKPRWQASLDLPVDDLLSTETTNSGDLGNGDATADMEYNSSNAMVDQLGLLNPVGFLLGQPSTGEGRKHRRYKGKQQVGKSAENQGSGCLLQ